MEGTFYANKQYSKRKYLEISGVPVSVANNGLESKFLKPLEKTDVTIDTRFWGLPLFTLQRLAKKSHHKVKSS